MTLQEIQWENYLKLHIAKINGSSIPYQITKYISKNKLKRVDDPSMIQRRAQKEESRLSCAIEPLGVRCCGFTNSQKV